MFKLASKLLALGCLVVIVVAVIVKISPRDANNYMAAARDKHRLLYSIKSPRIILAGGSNVAFSVDGQKIAKRFGLPVINMGLHAGVGLRFMLNEIQPALKKGDIVIVFPEYENFSDLSLDGIPADLGMAIKFCPECASGVVSPQQAFNAATGILQTAEGDLLRTMGKPEKTDRVYIRKGFNEWGDMVAHLNRPGKINIAGDVLSVRNTTFPNPAVDLLNSFYQSANAANARVFFMFPGIPIEDDAQSQKKEFFAFYRLLTTSLEIPILGTPLDFFYPKKIFYDTHYHLQKNERAARTNRIIELLAPALQNNGN